jgi:replicative DNA helicase
MSTVTALRRDVTEALRALPYNVEAERALLGAILFNNRTFDRVAEFLEADHFGDEANARIYDAIKSLIDQGRQANQITLKTFAEADDVVLQAGGMKYLTSLGMSFVTAANTEEYGRLIYDLWRRRELIALLDEAREEAFDGSPDMDVGALIESHLGATADLVAGKTASTLKTFGEIFDEVIKEHELIDKGLINGLSTGLRDLDRAQGLLEPEDLVIWAGRPSMGKSALMGTAAYHIAKFFAAEAERLKTKPKRVLIFSLEMSGKDNINRTITALTGIEAPRRRGGAELGSYRWGKLIGLKSEAHALPITVEAAPRATLSKMRAIGRRLQHKGGVGIVFVDFLQIMGVERGKRTQNRTEEVGYLVTGLKDLAKELGCPVVALSQLNRGVEAREDKRPCLNDLRESGEIEQAADTVAFCYRDEYYLERSEPKQKAGETHDKFMSRYTEWQQQVAEAHGKAEVIVAKARHGVTGTAKLEFDGARTWFSDSASAPIAPRAWAAGATHASFSAMPDGRPEPPVEGI